MPRCGCLTKVISVGGRAFLAILVFGLFFGSVARAEILDTVQNIGVVQYNVKNSQGGWLAYALPTTIDTQVKIIADRVRIGLNRKPSAQITAANATVDFISIVQSDLTVKGSSQTYIISELLKTKENLPGWQTINSFCDYDGTELAYSTDDWELVKDPKIVNPLVDATDHSSPQYGWGVYPKGGCDGRPYNIAYFNNKKTGFKLLYIKAHMPHCGDYDTTGNLDIKTCLTRLDMSLLSHLQQDILSVSGKTQGELGTVNLIMSGDMNEYGANSEYGKSGVGSAFAQILPGFGTFQLSTPLPTCCANSNYSQYMTFDHILATTPNLVTAYILNPSTGGYPLDPNFETRNRAVCERAQEQHPPKNTACANEEHKPIFGFIQFPLAAK